MSSFSTSRGQRPARRSRARIVVPLLLVAWLVLEVWLIGLVSQATSVPATLGLLVAGAVLGGLVIRRAGVRAWRALSAAVRAGATTVPESTGAGLVMLGGALLILPGFASDAVALLLLFPVTRALLRRAVHAVPTGHGPLGTAYQQARIHHPGGQVIQGEVIDRDAPAGPEGGPRA
ncbi:hypothetical protein AQ490_15510 [Wenjunlia vitaminophila]|uniref:FxsA family protein n=1 Tax=Wenjunlia vitaminophila TaxID=76728 RepID=A0A0T6LWF9_WENVI|nr:FxsA family membrane protein [Wenjunlia vitaminophila]KRV50487.1 hypothetical protein AQ490_15510 [Wenjunlia vitaminophila]